MTITPQNTRTLKIERAGDSFAGKTYPKIRLQGHWLAKLGFAPNERTMVIPLGPGELLLRSNRIAAAADQHHTTLILTVYRKV